MSITAKEIAARLGLSATAVSMALNNRPGVSTETRRMILAEAEKLGYDFSRISAKKNAGGLIYLIQYRVHNAIMSYSPIWIELADSIEQECRTAGYQLRILNFYEKTQELERLFEDIRGSGCAGIILIGSELKAENCRRFLRLNIPLVVLDSSFCNVDCNYILINNEQGAYLATSYLLERYPTVPGHLCSSYEIENFRNRRIGYELALREYGKSPVKAQRLSLTPNLEDAMADMLSFLDNGGQPARCYFADNDLIAIGAMKALKLRGFRIPEDVAVIGFDNISESRIIDPALTTIDVPRAAMARLAAERLMDLIRSPSPTACKIEVATTLVRRFSA